MSGLNEQMNVSFLIGARLQQLALGIYEFQFGFDSEGRISIQDKLFLESTGKNSVEIAADNPAQTKELFFLLGRTVQDAQINETKSLKLVFDDQSKITIPPSTSGYESYVIWSKNDVIAV